MDQYSVALQNGRSLSLSGRQVELVAIGLGNRDEFAPVDCEPPVVEALRTLPPTERLDAFAVALLRFGHRQDIESISHHSHLSLWEVCRLEDAFRQALMAVRARRSGARPERLN